MGKNKVEEPLESYERPLNFDKVWLMFQETDKNFKETDRRFKETDKQLKETDQRIKELSNLFTSQWGKLVESLVEGDLINLLNGRGIKVESVIQRRRGSRNGRNFEFDLIAINTGEVVIVEVKTTLRPDDVKDFLAKLEEAKFFMPDYRNMTIYGGMAFISADSGSEKMAENKGLFVIKATGGSSSIINGINFEPKKF